MLAQKLSKSAANSGEIKQKEIDKDAGHLPWLDPLQISYSITIHPSCFFAYTVFTLSQK